MTTRKELEGFLEREAELALGKVAYLRSGGPPMTIRSVKGKKIICEWFDKTNRCRQMEFLGHSLTCTPVNRDGRPRGIVVLGELAEEPTSESKND